MDRDLSARAEPLKCQPDLSFFNAHNAFAVRFTRNKLQKRSRRGREGGGLRKRISGSRAARSNNSVLLRFPISVYNQSMRRVSATLLLALLSVALIAPALCASGPDTNLPACCRRSGKHHCAVPAATTADSSGPALGAGACPNYRLAKIGPAAPAPGVAQSAVTVYSKEAAHRDLDTYSQPFNHSSYSRAGQKRGPPVLFV
jgi:hypothetical protein